MAGAGRNLLKHDTMLFVLVEEKTWQCSYFHEARSTQDIVTLTACQRSFTVKLSR